MQRRQDALQKVRCVHQNLHYVDDFDQSSLEAYMIDVIAHHITAPENMKSSPKQLFTTVTVNNSKDVAFQLDCRATCKQLPLKVFSSIMGNPQDLYLKRTQPTIKMYNGSTMSPVGKFTLRCTKGEMTKDVDLFIVDDDVRPLLGAETCQELNFIKVMVNEIANSHIMNSVNDKFQLKYGALTEERILKEYSDVFEDIGCMEGLCHLEADETVRPVVHPPRKVPVALRDHLKEELDKLVGEEIITPVTEPTKWVSSLVIVNKALKRAHYPLPTIEEVATRLSKARVLSVLDAKNGFWQVQLDKELSYLTTFNTPFGH